jgi:hypothetical protein
MLLVADCYQALLSNFPFNSKSLISSLYLKKVSNGI